MSLPNFFAAQTWTIRNELKDDPEAALQRLCDLGINVLEVANIGELTPKSFKSICDDLEIQIIGCHLPLKMHTDVKTYAKLVKSRCSDLGTKNLVIWAPDNMERTESAYIEMGSYIKELACVLNNSLKISYHIYNYDLMQLPDCSINGLEILLTNEDNSSLLFELDTYYVALTNNDPHEIMKRLSGRCHFIHINDIDTENAQAPIGMGLIDWEKIFPQIISTLNPQALILEHKTDQPFLWLTNSIKYLEQNQTYWNK